MERNIYKHQQLDSMPQKFVNCYKSGGRVRTVRKGGYNIPVCFKGGKSYAGEAKKAKHPAYHAPLHHRIHKKGK